MARPAAPSDVEVLPDLDVVRVKAANPSMLTLDGTNTWVLGRHPAWVVDPGPALEPHLRAVADVVAARGGAGGIALTHHHADHAGGLPALRARLGGGTGRGAPRAPPGAPPPPPT